MSLLLLLLLIGGGVRHHHPRGPPPDTEPYYWQSYARLNSYYNGVRTIVPFSKHKRENNYNQSLPVELITFEDSKALPHMPPLDPVVFDPYPNYTSYEYISKHGEKVDCFIDEAEKIPVPDVYVYPGIPQNSSDAFFGSYQELGIREDICYEKFGRLSPYGYGYNWTQGGMGPGLNVEHAGAEKVFEHLKVINHTAVNWGDAQKRCYKKNKARFDKPKEKKDGMRKVARHAYVMRIWSGYFWNDHQIYTLRAMINELALKSGGEYDVHFLLHIKDNSIPIWADKSAYRQAIEDNMPQEFWNMTTLWSEMQLLNYYPDPFPHNLENPSEQSVHGVYRGAHFALQWFSQQHPEYDFFWNWEMDLRYVGHYYEFNTALGDWARKQPRKGMWERNERFYIPAYHGSWANFTHEVEKETIAAGREAIWGPMEFENTGRITPPAECVPPTTYDEDSYQWGVGEDADLITFNPIFDPARANWVFRHDVTGYDLSLPPPPRRTAIITVSRLSKRLLDLMHEETWRFKHTMFPEMWPPSVALHHGLKAVYAPHPVFFDRDWDLNHMDATFNKPEDEASSPFAWGEHNFIGSTFYYNAGFSGALWRRWLGMKEKEEGGKFYEETHTGRLCLRSVLHHPIKYEIGQPE
ncbi:hypothetical protein BDV97DRAFT_293740 [Delphinella strobiligena]|nr:hypothetical protein BDV97DRAFT_293740 [Delphinella strobiligena]